MATNPRPTKVSKKRSIGLANGVRNYFNNFAGTVRRGFAPTEILAAGGSRRKSLPAIRQCHSPQALLLPYLELQPLYSQISFSESGSIAGDKPASTVNSRLLSTTVPVFICPDDKRPDGANSYRANMGVTPSPIINAGSSIPGAPTEQDTGAFRFNRALSPAEFIDGLANTVMFSEKLIGSLNSARFDPPRDCFYAGITIETVDDAVLVCRNALTPNPPHDAFCGTTWLFGGFDQTWYNHILPPNSSIPDCSSKSPGGKGAYTARSFHPGGANAAFADGSIRLINEDVDLLVWRAIGTRAGREAIGADFE